MPQLLIQRLRERFRVQPILEKFFKGTSCSIGLDIGSTSVKALKLQRAPAGLKLLKAATAPLAPGGDSSQRVAAIQQVMDELDGHEAPVVTGIGGQGTVLRLVLIPKMSPAELKGALGFEAEKYIPFKVEETRLDFHVVGDRPGGRIEVLLAAARQEVVTAHLEMLSGAGVSPRALDLEAVAMANAWELGHSSGDSEAVALIQVGARGTLLNVLRGSQLQFTREIPMAGNTLTQAVAAALGVDGATAEKIKCEPGQRREEVIAALEPRWEEWLAQCRASFDFYESQFGFKVARICVGGGSAALTGFQDWIKAASGLPVEEWDPLRKLTQEPNCGFPESHRSSFGIAVGLAVREAG